MKTEIIEIVSDPQLKKREKEITRIVRSFYPIRIRIKVYRIADGRIGLQTQETLTPANRKQIEKACRAITHYLENRRVSTSNRRKGL
jgi:hypothetical protein